MNQQESGSLREALEKLADSYSETTHPAAHFAAADMRRLLAAHPEGPARPLLDREAVRRLMADALNAYVQLSTPGYYNYVDSFVALGRPMPTQAELTDWLRDIFVTDADPEGTSWGTAAELLLALLNGES